MIKALSTVRSYTNQIEFMRRANLVFWIIVNRIQRSFSDSVEFSLPYLKFIGYVGVVGFPLYFYVWSVLFPQPYENILLRIIGCLLFSGFIFISHWPHILRRLLAVYWFITFLYALPFFFTFMLLMNEGNIVWAMSTMAGLTLLILIAHDWVLVILMFVLGSLLAFFAYYITTGTIVATDQYLVQLPIYLFLVVAGSIFNYKSIRVKQEKLKILATVGTDIAHELRTPLLTVKTNIDGLGKYMPALFKSHQLAKENKLSIDEIPNSRLNLLDGAVNRAQTELDKANTIIDIVLMNFNKSKIDTSVFEHFWIANVVEEAMERYPFQSQNEQSKIVWRPEGNFKVWGSDILLVHVLFNLFKNALHFMSMQGRGNISISLEHGSNENYLKFRDTARGIPNSELPNIFEYLYTTQSSGRNTGVGLAYCKKVMQYLRGDISCKSVPGEYTEFTLSFPIA